MWSPIKAAPGGAVGGQDVVVGEDAGRATVALATTGESRQAAVPEDMAGPSLQREGNGRTRGDTVARIHTVVSLLLRAAPRA